MLTFRRNSVYLMLGSFKSGLFQGKGTFEWYDFKANDVNIKGRKFEGTYHKGMRHGEGIYYDGKGEVWKGSWNYDKFEGLGIVTKTNGELLQGSFLNGKLHCDEAKIQFSNGDVYEGGVKFGTLHSEVAHMSYDYGDSSYTGQFSCNMKHGNGTRRFIDRSIYRGSFVHNVINGQGTMHYTSNDLKQYVGSWKDGLFHGDGELTFANNFHIESYKGNFNKGAYDGKGMLVYSDGGYYEGHFTCKKQGLRMQTSPWNGIKHGNGTRVWVSGNKFVGTWFHDRMKEGIFFDKVNSSKYIGSFIDNKRCGTSCREFWRSNDGKPFKDPCLGWKHRADGFCQYIGDYKCGVFHGQGVLTSSDGRKYDGDWKNGKQHGHGIAILLPNHQIGDSKRMYVGKQGTFYKPFKYEGEWCNGLRHGFGILTMLDGSTKEGTFVNGQLIKDS